MPRYLIVTHQTAFSPQLRQQVRALVSGEPAAEFGILVPDPHGMTSTWEGEAVEVARQRAEALRVILEETLGARVLRAVVGVADPLQAIGDELAAHPGYDVLVICTLPPGLSRWLKLDLVHRAERRFGLPVIHVVAEASAPVRQ